MSSTSPLSPPTVTMEKAKELFSDWRATRHKRCKIPAPLWEAVRHLVKVQGYSFTQLSSALGITKRQLKLNIESQSTRDKTLPAASHFIKIDLPLPQPMTPQLTSTTEQPISSLPVITLELIRPDGSILKASGMASQDLLSFVQCFIL